MTYRGLTTIGDLDFGVSDIFARVVVVRHSWGRRPSSAVVEDATGEIRLKWWDELTCMEQGAAVKVRLRLEPRKGGGSVQAIVLRARDMARDESARLYRRDSPTPSGMREIFDIWGCPGGCATFPEHVERLGGWDLVIWDDRQDSGRNDSRVLHTLSDCRRHGVAGVTEPKPEVTSHQYGTGPHRSDFESSRRSSAGDTGR